MNVLVDDHLLLACITGREPVELARLRGAGRLFTTGVWYHRLCRAIVVPGGTGALSAALGTLDAADAHLVRAAVADLPSAVGLVSFGRVAWPMAEILVHQRLNLVALEAIAAARFLRATICVSPRDEGPRLREAAEALGVPMAAIAA